MNTPTKHTDDLYYRREEKQGTLNREHARAHGETESRAEQNRTEIGETERTSSLDSLRHKPLNNNRVTVVLVGKTLLVVSPQLTMAYRASRRQNKVVSLRGCAKEKNVCVCVCVCVCV